MWINSNSTSSVTLADLKAAMKKMRAIRIRPVVIQCLDEDKPQLIESIPASGFPLPPIFGIPVKFYADDGEMAEKAFDLINEGNSVIQLRK